MGLFLFEDRGIEIFDKLGYNYYHSSSLRGTIRLLAESDEAIPFWIHRKLDCFVVLLLAITIFIISWKQILLHCFSIG